MKRFSFLILICLFFGSISLKAGIWEHESERDLIARANTLKHLSHAQTGGDIDAPSPALHAHACYLMTHFEGGVTRETRSRYQRLREEIEAKSEGMSLREFSVLPLLIASIMDGEGVYDSLAPLYAAAQACDTLKKFTALPAEYDLPLVAPRWEFFVYPHTAETDYLGINTITRSKQEGLSLMPLTLYGKKAHGEHMTAASFMLHDWFHYSLFLNRMTVEGERVPYFRGFFSRQIKESPPLFQKVLPLFLFLEMHEVAMVESQKLPVIKVVYEDGATERLSYIPEDHAYKVDFHHWMTHALDAIQGSIAACFEDEKGRVYCAEETTFHQGFGFLFDKVGCIAAHEKGKPYTREEIRSGFELFKGLVLLWQSKVDAGDLADPARPFPTYDESHEIIVPATETRPTRGLIAKE